MTDAAPQQGSWCEGLTLGTCLWVPCCLETGTSQVLVERGREGALLPLLLMVPLLLG